MNAITDKEKKREQGRIRSKKHYEKHSDKIKAAKALNRTLVKKIKSEKAIAKPVVFNEDVVIEFLKNREFKSEASQKKYINDIKKFFLITGCTDLAECLNGADAVIDQLENARQIHQQDKIYSVNSKLGFIQAVLYVITNCEGLKESISNDTIKQYKRYYDKLKMFSTDETVIKQEYEEVMKFESYLEKIKATFGKDSLQYLLASIYKEVPARDDFASLLVKTSEPTAEEVNENYLYIPSTKSNLIIILNNYKTAGKFGKIMRPLSRSLSTLFRSYLREQKTPDNTQIFPPYYKNGFTAFVGEMNRAIGIHKGSINYIRQSSVSSLSPNATPEDRLELADKMLHSAETGKKYKRKNPATL